MPHRRSAMPREPSTLKCSSRSPITNSQREINMSESVDDFVAAFEKAATVARAFGDSIGALQPLEGERLLPYRQRLARKYQAQSTQFKDVDLSKVGCEVTLAAIEDAIFQDALHPTSFKPGVLRVA